MNLAHKNIIFLMLCSIALMLSGCPSATLNEENTFIHTENNVLMHTSSGFKFPEKINNFLRDDSQMKQYDETGNNISVAYSNPAEPIIITVFVFPSPKITSFGSPDSVVAKARKMLTEKEFTAQKQNILDYHKESKLLISEQRRAFGNTYADYAEFEFQDDFFGTMELLQSRLYLFTYFNEKWTIKYRITYPKSTPTININRFVRNFEW